MKKKLLVIMTMSFASVQANILQDLQSLQQNASQAYQKASDAYQQASKVYQSAKEGWQSANQMLQGGLQTIKQDNKEALDAAQQTGSDEVSEPLKKQAQEIEMLKKKLKEYTDQKKNNV
jgi:hypothetical protein